MPSNRTVRLAGLDASVRRPPSRPLSSRTGSALKRRLVVGALVLVSLVLITVYFREPARGGLHDAQSAGATALRPFQVAAERVVRPFRDAYGYFAGLFRAKAENARLSVEVHRLRQQVIQNQSAREENMRLRELLRYRDGPTFPKDYRDVVAAVISRPPSPFVQQIGIAAGRRHGVRRNDGVVTQDGLVGKVTKVARDTAQVTLLTDESSAVSAVDLRTNAAGIVRHGHGTGEALFLDRVTKDEVVLREDVIVTAGWRSGALASQYPRGIPIGYVSSVGQTDIDLFKRVQITPFVDFGSLYSVIVLVPEQRGR